MEKLTFPGWAGPLVGAIAGVVLGFRYTVGEGAEWLASILWLVVFGLMGAAAGSVVWLVDYWQHRKQATERHQERRPRLVESPVLRAGLWFGLTVALMIVPVMAYLGIDACVQSYRMSKWFATTATILSSRIRTSTYPGPAGPTSSFTPEVEYRYTIGAQDLEGRTRELTARTISQAPVNVTYSDASKATAIVSRFPAGSTHTVYYDPKDPARAILELGMPWGDLLSYAGCLVGAAVIAVIILWALRAEQPVPAPP